MLNTEKILSKAEAMALKAKPWTLEHDGKVYTAVFNMKEWVYDVFEDGFFMMKINIKSPTKAKQFLSTWFVS